MTLKKNLDFIYLDNVAVNAVTFSDQQIAKEDKDWLYPQMIQTIKKVKDSIILVFPLQNCHI